MKELSVPQAIVIDFDRTISDVDASMERLYASAEYVDFDTTPIKKERDIRENDGGSYDPLSIIQKNLSEERLKKFYDHFQNTKTPTLLYDDAQPFLDKLTTHAIPYYLLTYGVNPEWQRRKVKASGYEGDMKILDHVDKGKEITIWRNSGSTFSSVKSICLIDDKPAAFQSLPDDCTGFLLQRESPLASQSGKLPSNVQTISSLDELTVINNVIKKI